MTENASTIAQAMFGVFNKKADEVKIQDESTGGGIYFNPDAKSAPNQVWRGIIKFLPKLYDLENPNKTETVETVTYWIPEGKNGFRYTSPKSIGKMENCIVANKYWEWKDAPDARLQKASKSLSYKKQFFALIQVISDTSKPENNGKLFLYDVPFAIQKKIKAIMFPSPEDIKMGAEANNIFDPLNGMPLVMKIPIKVTSEGEFRDYDECIFNEKLGRTMIVDFTEKDPTKLVQAKMPANEEEMIAYQTKAIETILAGPSLKDVEYKPASEETMKRIQKALDNIETGNIGSAEQAATGTEPAAETNQAAQATPETNQAATTSTEVKTEPATTANTTATTSAEDLVSQVMAGGN